MLPGNPLRAAPSESWGNHCPTLFPKPPSRRGKALKNLESPQ